MARAQYAHLCTCNAAVRTVKRLHGSVQYCTVCGKPNVAEYTAPLTTRGKLPRKVQRWVTAVREVDDGWLADKWTLHKLAR